MRRRPDVVHVAITCADNTVAIMAFVTREYMPNGTAAWSRQASSSEVEAEIARASTSFDANKRPIKKWSPIDPADVPSDRTFRDALRHDGKTFAHDMAHAREIHRDHIREARAGKLAALDVEYQKADEADNKAEKKRIAALKQELRDLTAHPDIDAAQTVEQLKAFWPASLG